MIAAARRDDAGGRRAREPERIADGDHPVADPHLVGVAPAHRRQRPVGVDLAYRPGRSCRPCRAGAPGNGCRLSTSFRSFPHSPMTWLLVTTMPSLEMMKPEPSAVRFAMRARHGNAGHAMLEEPFEEIAQRAFAELLRELRHRALGRLPLGTRLLGGDQYHRRTDLIDQIGEAFRRGPRQRRSRRHDRPDADRAAEHQCRHGRSYSPAPDRSTATLGLHLKSLSLGCRLYQPGWYVGETTLRVTYGRITDRSSAACTARPTSAERLPRKSIGEDGGPGGRFRSGRRLAMSCSSANAGSPSSRRS